MFEFLLKYKSSPIALDISSGGIRMLQMKRIGGRLAATACARWKYPAGLNGDRRTVTVEALRDMLRSGGFQGRRVISSLPTGQLGIKNVRLPHMEDKQMREAVLWEAKERFGFDFKGDQLSYINAGAVRQGTETRDEIIMIAIPPQMIDEHLGILDEAGLRPEHIDAEPVALFRSLERFLRRVQDEQAVTVVVDIGLSGARVVVARGRQIIFIKAIDIGGKKFTEAVAKQLNLSCDEACELRNRIIRERPEGRLPDNIGKDANSVNWTIHDALRAEVESLAREIALCLRYCSVTFRGLRPDRVTVTGGEAYDSSVVSLLAEHLGIECVVGQPLKGIDTSAVDLGADRRGTLAEWSICAGLAGRGIEVPLLRQIGEQEGDLLTA